MNAARALEMRTDASKHLDRMMDGEVGCKVLIDNYLETITMTYVVCIPTKPSLKVLPRRVRLMEMNMILQNRRSALLKVCAFLLLLTASIFCAAQQPNSAKALTADDYAHAEQFLTYKTTPLVYHSVRPTWIDDVRFWYRDTGAEGTHFVLYDTTKQTRQPAFDHAKLATALSDATGRKLDPNKLPFMTMDLSADGNTVSLPLRGKKWNCDLQVGKCSADANASAPASPRVRALDTPSPDKKRTAFIRNWNLWVRDLATGKETQLTKDGVKDYGYATDNAGWTHSDAPIVLWSPDSKKIASFQQDQRKVGEMYLVETKVGHPKLDAWKYPLPGDDVVTMIERVVIDVDAAKVVRFQIPPEQHRTSLCDHLVCRGSDWADIEWSPDSTQVAFVSNSRDHKQAQLRVADAATGTVRNILEETVATQYESGQGRFNWHYLPASNEIIWYSERDNWGHLYLYDAQTGKLKNQVTSGDWVVTQLLRIDEKARTLYLLGVGREKGRDLYFAHLYKVGFDGKGLTLLTPEDANHEITFSPSARTFIDVYSTPQTPPVAVLRDPSGKQLATIEKADISKLVAAGWQPPTSITVKARDGVTDLYGLMYKPTKIDPAKKYPIVNNIYPGPQGGSVGSRSFSPSRGDAQALAELGFIVVQIDGMGNPLRSKKFHDAYYGNLGDNTLPDQITAMKQLAQKYTYIDLDRAGIYGHSGGGYAAADAMFRYPDFFKVGISEAGNHDNRLYEDDWGERYQGMLKKNPDGTSNYDDQANQSIAKNLKGKLLLAHGTMDDNVPPVNTMLVVNELIKANKDFDLLLLPNRRHGFGNEPYMVRRRWDYFVRNLLDMEPPAGFELKPPRGAMDQNEQPD
jgi:dipeptidyl-peptidase 4